MLELLAKAYIISNTDNLICHWVSIAITWVNWCCFFSLTGKMMRNMTSTERPSEASYEFVRHDPNSTFCVSSCALSSPLRKKTAPIYQSTTY